MTEEIDSTEETVVDPIDEVVEKTLDTSEVVEPTEEESEVERLKRDNENYKRELEGYRKPNTQKLQKQVHTPSSDNSAVENDYMSKSADVIDELKSELESLSATDYKRIESRIIPTMKAEYDLAVKQGSYVARGKLKDAVSELIEFARWKRPVKTALEKEREQEQLDSAEISAVRPAKKVNTVKATETDARLAEDSGIPVATITANRLAREKREQEFRKNMIHV